jgi:hypothetical protein
MSNFYEWLSGILSERMYWLPEKLRWNVASFLNKRTDTCWNSWCNWAAFGTEQDVLSNSLCKQEAKETGACYCHKFTEPA